MARIKANAPMDSRATNLHEILRFATGSKFRDDANATFAGKTYEDVLEIDWAFGGDSFTTYFGGTGVTMQGRQTVTGGTVEGILTVKTDGAKQAPVLGIDSFSLSAVDLNKAILSRNTRDDKKIFEQIFAGDDKADLSRFNDFFRGLGGDDQVKGNRGNDKLFGEKGDDMLDGGAGRDLIVGGSGKDMIAGRKGADTLNGGKDADTDTFLYFSVDDSKVGRKGRDKIIRFDSGEDKIDLSRLDGDSDTAGNQALTFSASGPAKNAVWLTSAGKNVKLRADVDGDSKADFEILLLRSEVDSGDLIL